MRLSVAICTWNGEKHLEGQLRSILGQERLPDEVVLRDDGSTDRTREIARDLLANAPFRVDIAENPTNLGSTRNFQGALEACTGDILLPCDQDDLWLPAKLGRVEDEFRRSGSDVVFHDSRLFDSATGADLGSHWERLQVGAKLLDRFERASDPLPFLLKQPFVTGCCMALRREVLDASVPFGKAWIHDEWMALCAASLGMRLRPLRERLVDYRQHPVQQVGVANTTPKAMLLRVLRADREAYLEEAARMAALESHLERAGAPAEALAKVRDKKRHNEVRAVMGEPGRPGRWRGIARELASGRYSSYSWWRAAPLKDAARIAGSWLRVGSGRRPPGEASRDC